VRSGASRPLIFISIAAYRDPEVGPTIEDCLRKARFPGRLRFAVCWQHGEDEIVPRCFADRRIRVIDVGWRESRGACWARAEIMKLWAGEDWYLQLDSHHRFVKDWDVELLQQATNSGSPKPVITTYAPPYTPGLPDPAAAEPVRIEFDRFSEDGIPMFRPGHFAGWRDRVAPIRGRFASAHLFFAPGEFAREVPYDPELYFTGEEAVLALRAFTHGYDIFEPSRLVVWHEYTRAYRRKHWDDHLDANRVELAWHRRDASSRKKVQKLLRQPWVGPFGCGMDRTVAAYQAYAGIDFELRRVDDYTRHNLEPPNPATDAEWQRPHVRKVHIMLAVANLPQAAVDDAQFWYVGFHGANGEELYRQDADPNELQPLLVSRPSTVTLTRTFESATEPATWTVMPYSLRDGWLNSITGPVTHDHVALGEPVADVSPP
jgi:Glycosyltransferase (GlcNAc)